MLDYLRIPFFETPGSFMWWNEIFNGKIGPINIWRILFAVELVQSQRKSNLSSNDNLVLDVEFLKILN